MLLTQKAGLWRNNSTESRIIENSANTKNWLCKTRGGKKPEEGSQLHGGAQGVLSRHKNADCKSCVKES
jgi:hypothetical protein